MKNIFFHREGQIAPFMIAIIVVLIMALMVTANIGKIALTKTHTANAADAGTLAGSTTHANTLNNLADTNTAMIAEYLSTEALFLVTSLLEIEAPRFLAYWAFIVAQSAQFVLAWTTAYKGYNDARSVARQFAFMNAGIDESKERLPGESYESYLQRESKFGQWMKEKGYESGRYTWTDKNGKQNSFNAEVEAPDFPGLIPTPGVFVSVYFKWITPCTALAAGLDCAPCSADAAQFFFLVKQAQRRIPFALNLGTAVPAGSFTPIAQSDSGIVVPPFCPPGGAPAWAVVIYYVPIAWIGGIVEDNPKISVTTTRDQPNVDLGLREMKYGDISSGANAEAKGGSVGPFPNPGYDSNLISGGY